MPVPAVDADKRGDAYKKVKPVEGIDEQGLVPDPQVMHVLFARLMAILGPLGILPIIFAVNSVTTAVNFAAASMGAREDFEPAPAALDSITANQRNQMHNMYDHPDFPNTQARNWRRLAAIAAGLPDYMMLGCSTPACIKMASAPASAPTQKTQHLDGKFHWLRQQVVHVKSLKLVYIPTAQQAADFLTKACPRVLVRRFLHALDGSAPDIVNSSVLSGSAPAGAVGTALHGPPPFVINRPTNIKPTRTPLSTHLHL